MTYVAPKEGERGHCSLCDQRLGLPSWSGVSEPKKEAPTIRTPPTEILVEGWLWVDSAYGWTAKSKEGKECCYFSKPHGLLACIGSVPYSIRVAVANAMGCSAI